MECGYRRICTISFRFQRYYIIEGGKRGRERERIGIIDEKQWSQNKERKFSKNKHFSLALPLLSATKCLMVWANQKRDS